MKYVLFKTYVTGHDILCPNEVSGQNEFFFCIFVKVIYPTVHMQNVIGIYQVVSEILKNLIVMVLRILEKNQEKIVIFFS
jgi:hypothetical protein